MSISWIDIVIIIPLAYAAWKGFQKGLVVEIFSLLALLVGIYISVNFSDWTANWLRGQLEIEGKYLPVVAFTVTFLGVAIGIFFLGKLIESMLKALQLSMTNKLLGLVFGTIKVLYVISIVLVLIETYDERGSFVTKDLKEESLLYEPLQQLSVVTIPAMEESTIWLKNNIDF
ncbi:MAG: CvpA family protein [Brumimicrobium sp.]